jgi:lipoic acid synthetase
VEALTPDFSGKHADVATVLDSGLDVFAQNLETVEAVFEIEVEYEFLG